MKPRFPLPKEVVAYLAVMVGLAILVALCIYLLLR
jgi:hypothetical protein